MNLFYLDVLIMKINLIWLIKNLLFLIFLI